MCHEVGHLFARLQRQHRVSGPGVGDEVIVVRIDRTREPAARFALVVLEPGDPLLDRNAIRFLQTDRGCDYNNSASIVTIWTRYSHASVLHHSGVPRRGGWAQRNARAMGEQT